MRAAWQPRYAGWLSATYITTAWLHADLPAHCSSPLLSCCNRKWHPTGLLSPQRRMPPVLSVRRPQWW